MTVRQPPIAYMQRTREYYRRLGYEAPYRWAHCDAVPFTRLMQPLNEATIGLVTTATPFRPELGDQGPGAPYNGGAKFFEVYTQSTAVAIDVRIAHIAYDRVHTSAEDINSYFPLAALKRAAAAGTIARVAARFMGLPTDRSQAATLDKYAPAVLRYCREDGADAVVLFPNCPVCHQSVSLVARYLEEHGIPTVVFGCARDIVEFCGVPRFLFSDFPLGNAAGKPFDVRSQDDTLYRGLRLLVEAEQGGTTAENPDPWSESDAWKDDYCNVDALPAEELARLRREFDREKARGRANK